MLHAAATATGHTTGSSAGSAAGWIWLIIAGATLAYTVYYLGACAVYPYTNCRRCRGIGRFHARDGHAWRRCRRCKGTGARLRVGRRILNHLRRIYRGATH